MTVVINGTTGYSGPVGVLGDLTTTGNTILGDQSTDTLNVANGNLVLNSSGNVGIGTSSPSTKLHVNTGSAGYGITIAANLQTGRTYQLGVDSNSSFALYDSAAAAQRLVVDTSGNLGLGVTPSSFSGAKFMQINGSVFAGDDTIWRTRMLVNAYNDGSYRYLQNNYAQMYVQNSSSGDHAWYISPSGTAGNAITFTQAMTLDASGNLGIGTSSNRDSTKLDVRGDITFGGNASYYGTLAYNAGAGFVDLTSSDGGFRFIRRSGSAVSATLDSSGNLGLGVTPSTWYSTSKALQIGASATLSDLGGSYMLLGQNYKTGTAGQDVYLNTGAASLYSQNGGAHRWYAAPSGTAGANMTLAQTMTLDSSGRLTTIYQPSFSAYGPISIGVGNIVRYTATRSNVGGHYNTATGVFTAPIAGVYFFTFNSLMNVNGDYVRLLFRWNGTAATEYGDTLSGGTTTAWAGWSYISIGMSWVISLGAGDTISVWNDGPTTTYGVGYGTFSGYMLG